MSKSYLKYIGGKNSIAEELVKRFPDSFKRYIEPFCGSCALFVHFYSKEASNDIFSDNILIPALLNDTNGEVVNCHQMVMDHFNEISCLLREYEFPGIKENPEKYYRDMKNRHGLFYSKDRYTLENKISRASIYIFLNKTSFNGLYRLNRKGEFNVPWNQKKTIRLSDKSLSKCSELFKQYATFSVSSFEKFIPENAKKDDFFFVDPPYIPLSATSSFVSYTKEGWSSKDDIELAKQLDYLDFIGAKFMMTNSDCRSVYDLFGGKNRNIETIKVHRFVKALNGEEVREKINEVVIRNY